MRTGLNGGCQLEPHEGTDTSTSLNLGARRLGQSRLTLSRQFEEHAQTVIETFLVVTLFPFLEGVLPRFTLSAKRLRNILVKPAARLGGPLNPHRRNVRSASLEKPIAFQDTPISTVKQCCFSCHARSPLCGVQCYAYERDHEHCSRVRSRVYLLLIHIPFRLRNSSIGSRTSLKCPQAVVIDILSGRSCVSSVKTVTCMFSPWR
jgi:hypothetical protein